MSLEIQFKNNKVMTLTRHAIYGLRLGVLEGDDSNQTLTNLIKKL